MISSSLDNIPVYTDFQGLNKLRLLAKNSPDEALEAVARQFEALFTQALLKGMRSTSLSEGLFDSDQSRLYQDLFDKQIATNLSQQRGIGLADSLIRQLRGAMPQKPDSSLEPIPQEKIFPVNSLVMTKEISAKEYKFKSPDDYIKTIFPMAMKIESQHGISAEAIIAQSALETGWGKHIMPASDGGSSHNLFAIKADSRWAGATTSQRTLEYSNGIAETKNERFRSYESFEESMNDYVSFLKSSPRYSQALGQSSLPEKFSMELQKAGYATDPEYSTKINKIMNSQGFVSLLSELKNGLSEPLT